MDKKNETTNIALNYTVKHNVWDWVFVKTKNYDKIIK